MKTFKEFVLEAGAAAMARAGEREWHSQLTDTNKVSKARMPAVDTSHKEKMFKFHAKMVAAAKVKGDTAGASYHNAKLKQYS